MFTISLSPKGTRMSQLRRGRRLRYSKTRVLFDFVLTILTGGLWFLWIIIRFLRSNT